MTTPGLAGLDLTISTWVAASTCGSTQFNHELRGCEDSSSLGCLETVSSLGWFCGGGGETSSILGWGWGVLLFLNMSDNICSSSSSLRLAELVGPALREFSYWWICWNWLRSSFTTVKTWKFKVKKGNCCQLVFLYRMYDNRQHLQKNIICSYI